MVLLLIDFGASRIKSCLYDTDREHFLNIFSTPGASLNNIDKVSLRTLNESFNQHIQYHKNFNAIIICCEMHGFILCKDIKHLLDCEYISWRVNSKINKDYENRYEKSNYKNKTGIALRSGLPYCNLINHDLFEKDAHFLTLTDALILLNGEWMNKSPLHLAAATAMYDIFKKEWITELCVDNHRYYSSLHDFSKPLGYITKDKKEQIPIFGGLGDLQASIFSIDINKDIVNLNLGTGSQISMLYDKTDTQYYDLRPLKNNNYISTITHIPCGRALQMYVNIFSSKKSQLEFWESLFKDDSTQIELTEKYPLGIFPGSYNYNSNFNVSSLSEHTVKPSTLAIHLKRELFTQYQEIIKNILVTRDINKILVTGSLGNKIENFSDILQTYTGIECNTSSNEFDSTLIGLKNFYIDQNISL
tara:strand:- start:187 stop:1440 length:1254 start_codon:yes stop_codon:yes gene_type:complete